MSALSGDKPAFGRRYDYLVVGAGFAGLQARILPFQLVHQGALPARLHRVEGIEEAVGLNILSVIVEIVCAEQV